jgi:GMP synthase (glutamine-hydrolysing)
VSGPPPVRPWVCVRHSPFEDAGVFAEVAREHGVALRTVATDLGEPVPDAGDVAGVIVLGGPFAVADAEARAHLADEIRLMGGAARAGLPVMGVCLGAQLLASALGAPVRPAAAPERGMRTIDLTPAGTRDPLLGPEGPVVKAFQYHEDTYELPPGAERLATSPGCPEQAFRAGPLVYGLQFHIELSEPFAEFVVAEARPAPSERTVLAGLGRRIAARFMRLATTSTVQEEVA